METKDRTDIGLLKRNLNTFLTFKYVLDNDRLEKEINKDEWKEAFINWPSIFKVLTLKETPVFNQYFPSDTKLQITVILPEMESDAQLNYDFLKAAAFYPYQLDPASHFDYSYDEDILIQLSFAAHYGYWSARYKLYQLDLQFPLLQGHIICDEEPHFLNYNDHYYTMDVPPEFHRHSRKGKNTLPFDPKSDKENLWKFCDYLVKIVETGVRPEGNKYDYKNYEYINRNGLK